MITTVTTRQITRQARTYLGTPFHHAGRVKGVGVDCAGLVICVGHDLRLLHTDYTAYGRQPVGGTMTRLLNEQMDEVPLSEARAGDVFLMRFRREPQHLAMKTSKGIIHSYMGVGKVVEHRLDKIWRERIMAAYRFRGLV